MCTHFLKTDLTIDIRGANDVGRTMHAPQRESTRARASLSTSRLCFAVRHCAANNACPGSLRCPTSFTQSTPFFMLFRPPSVILHTDSCPFQALAMLCLPPPRTAFFFCSSSVVSYLFRTLLYVTFAPRLARHRSSPPPPPTSFSTIRVQPTPLHRHSTAIHSPPPVLFPLRFCFIHKYPTAAFGRWH